MQNSFYKLPAIALVIACAHLLSACTTSSQGNYSQEQVATNPTEQQSTALGTQWGEGIQAPVETVNLKRISNTPLDLITIQYSATQARGKTVQDAMLANGRVRMSVIGENGQKLALVQDGQSIYLKGINGQRYELRYQNHSANTYEIVATVDGLDVLNGSKGSIQNSGYVLPANGSLTIQGFRSSQKEVAAFRFSSPDDAYASNTPAGFVKNIGVIGTAVFELNAPKPDRCNNPSKEQAFPADNSGASSYAPPPCYSPR